MTTIQADPHQEVSLPSAPPAAPTREPALRRAPSPRAVLMVASLGVFMAFVDATIVNIAFPDIASSFSGESVSTLSWVLNAYNIVFAAFLLAGGKLADLLGRRRVFLIGLAVFTLASGLCAIAPSAGALVAFRILQAVGAAFVVPASLALVLDAFPPDRRAHAVALFSAVAALAAGIGPSLGGLLVSVSDWRLVFLVNVPVGIVAYLLAKRHLVESRAPGRRRMPDLPGSIVFALSVSALVFGVIKGSEDWGWTDPRVLGSFAASLVFGAIFFRRSARHRAPLFELDLLKNRTFSAANAMTIVASAGFYGYTLCNVLFLTYVWGYSALEAGLALTPGPFIAAAVAGPTSRLAERFGHRWVLVFGALTWGGGVFWFVTQVGLFPDFVGTWLPGMVLLGIGAGATFPNLSGAAVASAPGESFGTATGLNSVGRQVGAALGVAIVIAIIGTPDLFNALDAFDRAWTFCALALITSGIGCLLVGRIGHDLDVRRSPSIVRATLSVLNSPDRVEAEPVYAPVLRPTVPAAPADTVAPTAETTSEFLKRVPLFADLPPLMRRMLSGRATNGRIAAGKTLFYAGDPGDSLYVVRAGRLEIVGPDGAVMREIGRGACIGELAVLSGSTRAFTVRAARTSDLIRISAADFQTVLHDVPELSIALNRTLAEQLRSAGAPPAGARPRAATIAIVPLDRRVPEPTIAFALSASLGAHARVAALRGSDVETPSYGEAAATYAPLLDRAEAANDQVLLVAGNPAQPDPWTDFCLQQADRVVAISSGGTPAPAALQRPELRGCDLVGWDVPVGSGILAEWADALAPIETHALNPATLEAGIDRLGRRLSGRSVGLVLSGGGARGFSHIGVIEELLDAGVVIDRIAGVSMGAFIGGLLALGLSPEEIDARAYEEWVRRKPLGDYTLPRHSLIRGHRAEAMLRRTFGDARVEELERGFISTAADLRDGSQIIQRHGELWHNVGKSMAIPVLVPPVVEGRKLIVDGSLVDNLPIGPMADLAEGPIIAVDLKTSFDGPAPGASARAERLPSIGETLTRVVFSGSSNTSEAARRHADLIIKPRNVGVGLFEWHQIDRARESGRAAAREAIAHAPASIFR